MKTTLLQAGRFAVVGIISNAFGFVWYLLLTWFGMGPKMAMSLLYLIGTLQTFVFNKRWSFRYGGQDRAVLARYLACYGMGYLLNFFALLLLVDFARMPHVPVQAAMVFAVAFMMFLIQKFWVFKSRSP